MVHKVELWILSIRISLLFPLKPIFIQYCCMRTCKYRLAGKFFTFTTKIQFLIYHAVPCKAVSVPMFIYTPITVPCDVSRTGTTIETAFSNQIIYHFCTPFLNWTVFSESINNITYPLNPKDLTACLGLFPHKYAGI